MRKIRESCISTNCLKDKTGEELFRVIRRTGNGLSRKIWYGDRRDSR